MYGLPGAVWFNHKTLLLFPFTSTVNNYTGAVTDISNQGYRPARRHRHRGDGPRAQQAEPEAGRRPGLERRDAAELVPRTCRAGASLAPR